MVGHGKSETHLNAQASMHLHLTGKKKYQHVHGKSRDYSRVNHNSCMQRIYMRISQSHAYLKAQGTVLVWFPDPILILYYGIVYCMHALLIPRGKHR